MSSEKTKKAWEPSEASVKAGDSAYTKCLMGTPPLQWDGKSYDAARRKYAIAAVSADPLLSAAKDMQDALDALEQAFIAHTQWNGALPAEVIAARAALAKSRGEL